MLRIIASVLVTLCGAFGVQDAAAQQGDRNVALTVSQTEVALTGEADALERLSQPRASIQYSEIAGQGGVRLERFSQAAQLRPIETGPTMKEMRRINSQGYAKVQPAVFSNDDVATLQIATYKPGLEGEFRALEGRRPGSLEKLDGASVEWPDERLVSNQINAAIRGYGASSLSSGGNNPRQFEGVFDQRVMVEGAAVDRGDWKPALETPEVPAPEPVSLPPAESGFVNGASQVEPDTHSRRSILTGSVYVDLNGDGVRQDGEPGLAGVEIVSGDANHSFRSDRSGFFASRSLREGAYRFSIDPTTLPLGYSVQSSGARLANLRSYGPAHVDLPVVIAGQVSGALFVDLDTDGRMSATDQLLEGQEVQLVDKQSGRARTSRSASFGQFGFENVRPGQYVLRVNVAWQEYAVDVSVTEAQALTVVALAVPPAVAGLQPVQTRAPRLLMADIPHTKKPDSLCCRANYGQSDGTVIRRLP